MGRRSLVPLSSYCGSWLWQVAENPSLIDENMKPVIPRQRHDTSRNVLPRAAHARHDSDLNLTPRVAILPTAPARLMEGPFDMPVTPATNNANEWERSSAGS